MNKISCDVCLDLLPLVQDGVASADSEYLVLEHIKECSMCRTLFTSDQITDTPIDDVAITKKIKNHLLFSIITIILFGISIGIMITDSMNMFYNALIMPAIGGFGYLFLRRKVFYAPLAVFLFSTVWNLISNISEGFLINDSLGNLLIGILFMSGIYTLFSLIGVIIAWLLCYAFKKEDCV